MYIQRASLILCFLAIGCGIQTNVGHPGEYTSLPEAEVADTNLYPMKHFILVEEDALSGKTFIYAFSGDLSGAGIGIESLERIALRHGRYSIAFRYPRSFFLEQTIESTGSPISVMSSEDTVAGLQPLEVDDHLYLSGAYPVLRTTSMNVQAWFGSYTTNEVDGPISFILGEETITLNSPLGLPSFTITPEEDRITMSSGTLSGLDYRVMELYQTGASLEDGSPREFTVATSLAPDTEYLATHLLIEDAFGKSCWTTEKSLKLRITQIARRYYEKKDEPWAVIYRKINGRNLAPDDWLPTLNQDNVETADYCESYN